MALNKKDIKQETEWLEISIKVYRDALKTAKKYESKEKIEEYTNELKMLMKKLERIKENQREYI